MSVRQPAVFNLWLWLRVWTIIAIVAVALLGRNRVCASSLP